MNLSDIPICDFMPFNLNRYIDILYTQYYIIESQGISEKLLPIAADLYNIINPYMNNIDKDIFVYTGYYWNFDKQEFIKLNNKKIHILYI